VPLVSRETHQAARAVGRPTLIIADLQVRFTVSGGGAVRPPTGSWPTVSRETRDAGREADGRETLVNASQFELTTDRDEAFGFAKQSSVRRPGAPARLADTSWNEGELAAGTRYHTLETLRAFGTDRPAVAGEDEAAARHLTG